MRPLLIFIAAIICCSPVMAADLTVTLRMPTGQPVRDAVVSFRPTGARPAPPRPTGAYEMVQEGIQFTPYVLIVPVGAQVVFPNKDKVRHHVYSFSAAKRFEIKLYGREETRQVVFDKAGVVGLGCNIHDPMSAFIVVTDTPFAVKSDASGRVNLAGLPTGPGVLTVWHPQLRTLRNEMTRPLTSTAGVQAFTLDLRATPGATAAAPGKPITVAHAHAHH